MKANIYKKSYAIIFSLNVQVCLPVLLSWTGGNREYLLHLYTGWLNSNNSSNQHLIFWFVHVMHFDILVMSSLQFSLQSLHRGRELVLPLLITVLIFFTVSYQPVNHRLMPLLTWVNNRVTLLHGLPTSPSVGIICPLSASMILTFLFRNRCIPQPARLYWYSCSIWYIQRPVWQ